MVILCKDLEDNFLKMSVHKTYENITQHSVRGGRIQGGPERSNTYDQLFQENEGQNNQVVCNIAYKIRFPARWHQDH